MKRAVLVIDGAPRTKKNHGRIVPVGKRCRVCRGSARHRLLPSHQWEAYEAMVLPYLRRELERAAWQPLEQPVHVAAVFFRERRDGDLVGYLQGLADLLEKAGVLKNDRLIVNWDGSRMDHDALRPRVELTLRW